VLVSDPVVAFEETGGSSGGSKLVPYTDAALDGFRRALMPWLDDLYTRFPSLDDGSAYWSISPACREPRLTGAGVPIGLPGDAAYFGADLAGALIATLCVPPGAGALRDVDAWRHFTACHLLADASLALISVWSPSFLLMLLRHAQADVDRISNCIARGDHGLGAAAGATALPSPGPDPIRAREIRAALTGAVPDFARLWPKLAVVSCWDQSTSAPYADVLRQHFPSATVQGKGLLATEGVVSIPLADYPMPVLAVDSVFCEFLDGQGVARFADEVVAGEEYDLVMTNDSGFYRYAIGDRVRVPGFIGQAPMLEFLGRTGLASDLAGEKLTEHFVATALAGLGLRFAMLAPGERPRLGYTLLLDSIEVSADAVDRITRLVEMALRANPQYDYARQMDQLAPLKGQRCREPLRCWIDAGLQRGQRLGDIKPAALCIDAVTLERFSPVS